MTLIDLSHTMSSGLQTYKGLPAIHVCDYLSRTESRTQYSDNAEFQIDQISMVGNSGTYLDSPFHRFEDGKDLAALALEATVEISGLVIRAPFTGPAMEIGESYFEGRNLKGKAVLVETGWSKHFGTEAYFEGHPFLSQSAAVQLKEAGVKLVGIDSHNIDDTRQDTRPAHTELLGADIPIVEHLTNLSALPDQGFKFSAAPLKFEGVGTFPVRALARIKKPKKR